VYISDLSIYEYKLPFPLSGVRCVGWIDPSHAFSRRPPPQLLVAGIQKAVLTRTSIFDAHANEIIGWHPCTLCGSLVSVIASDGSSQKLGTSEIIIPSNTGWFAAPSLILHYVIEHGYDPPIAFQQAVMSLDYSVPFNGQEVFDRLCADEMAKRKPSSPESGNSTPPSHSRSPSSGVSPYIGPWKI
jgi:hypothetical protein